MASRLASDTEVDTWREEGWVLLEGLVASEDIDAAGEDLHRLFPTVEEYAADPEGVVRKRTGSAGDEDDDREDAFWPVDGPGFRKRQHIWVTEFPFPGSGALNRLCLHPSVVDFAERALGTPDIRLYQSHATAAYAGITNYEQPMHIDRNHSWLPPVNRSPWWNLEGFLYLSDVTESDNATRVVSLPDSAHVAETTPVVMPADDPALYRSEHRAIGRRGSYLAYRSDVFHRGAPFGGTDRARFLLALAFKRAGQEWIAYNQAQSKSTQREWLAFAQRLTPRQLELFGFPPPGHPIWDQDLLDRTALRYPRLDLEPWRQALDPGPPGPTP